MDTYTDIRNVIEPYLSEYWTVTQIHWPNTSFAPPEAQPWIQPAILPGRVEAATLGTGGSNHVPGLLHINVFVPKAQGTETAWTLVDGLRALFNRKTVGHIRFRAPYPTPAITGDQRLQIPVLCPFTAFECVGE